jgi:hypothetical protein
MPIIYATARIPALYHISPLRGSGLGIQTPDSPLTPAPRPFPWSLKSPMQYYTRTVQLRYSAQYNTALFIIVQHAHYKCRCPERRGRWARLHKCALNAVKLECKYNPDPYVIGMPSLSLSLSVQLSSDECSLRSTQSPLKDNPSRHHDRNWQALGLFGT